MVLHDRLHFMLVMPKTFVVFSIDRFHSRDQQPCKFIVTKESFYIRKEFNSHRIGFTLQHGRRFIVFALQHGRRDVTWKPSTKRWKRQADYLIRVGMNKKCLCFWKLLPKCDELLPSKNIWDFPPSRKGTRLTWQTWGNIYFPAIRHFGSCACAWCRTSKLLVFLQHATWNVLYIIFQVKIS